MTENSDSAYISEWFTAGDKDWRRVGILLENEDEEGAAFHLQQALEKYLKGFLLSKGWELKRIHDLETLLDEAVKLDEKLESFRSLCERVSNYYFSQRYPPIIPLDTNSENVKNDLDESEKMRTILKSYQRQ
jgi:HEPN domain-containing protein